MTSYIGLIKRCDGRCDLDKKSSVESGSEVSNISDAYVI